MRKLKQISVVILKTRTGYSAHSPMVDGCATTGKTIDKTLNAFKKAIKFHLEGQLLLKNDRKLLIKTLRDSFSNYGTEAVYATIEVAA